LKEELKPLPREEEEGLRDDGKTKAYEKRGGKKGAAPRLGKRGPLPVCQRALKEKKSLAASKMGKSSILISLQEKSITLKRPP